MLFDRERYRHHLSPLNLPRAHEDDVLDFLHSLCEETIACAFGQHPVQHVLPISDITTGESAGAMLDSLCDDANTAFDAFKDQAI